MGSSTADVARLGEAAVVAVRKPVLVGGALSGGGAKAVCGRWTGARSRVRVESAPSPELKPFADATGVVALLVAAAAELAERANPKEEEGEVLDMMN